jgi:predicted nuclease of predicted toxin-antitoxin system
MKLLFDENLSRRLVALLADIYPGSEHVVLIGLKETDDAGIWEYARQHGFTVVSKDADFHQRSLLAGAPPKFVWIRLGNCTTAEIATLLREQSVALHTFADDSDLSHLIFP